MATLEELLQAINPANTYQRYIGQPFANVAGPFGRGLLGFDLPDYGEEQAYRTGQAIGNMPAVAAPVGVFKAAMQAPKALEAMQDLAPLLGMAYRVSTPKNIDPSVGTRYERQFMGGLAEKTPVRDEDLLGASVMVMPWDSSNRNYRITNVSDVPLKQEVITHGGQDYARDLAHIQQGIVGASNKGIAKRIADRDAIARQENLAAGGSGVVIHLPITMGEMAEDFSVMPVDTLVGILDAVKLSKKDIKEFDDMVRSYVPPDKVKKFKDKPAPFTDFAGIMTEKGREQLLTGEKMGLSAGELRKAVMNRARLKGNQERFGFNVEDLVNAITDPSLVGVPKGYVGNTVIMSPENMRLLQSANRTYDTDFTGKYLGTLGRSIPVEAFFPQRFSELAQEFSEKTLSDTGMRNAIIGALEKRKEGVSELIDERALKRIRQYLNQP
jgi:hypothetical protein